MLTTSLQYKTLNGPTLCVHGHRCLKCLNDTDVWSVWMWWFSCSIFKFCLFWIIYNMFVFVFAWMPYRIPCNDCYICVPIWRAWMSHLRLALGHVLYPPCTPNIMDDATHGLSIMVDHTAAKSWPPCIPDRKSAARPRERSGSCIVTLYDRNLWVLNRVRWGFLMFPLCGHSL